MAVRRPARRRATRTAAPRTSAAASSAAAGIGALAVPPGAGRSGGENTSTTARAGRGRADGERGAAGARRIHGRLGVVTPVALGLFAGGSGGRAAPAGPRRHRAGRSLLDRRFDLAERGTTPRTEALGGLSTFLTMSYILVVNPAILSAAKMPVEAVAVATALAAAIATAAMAWRRTCRSRSRPASGSTRSSRSTSSSRRGYRGRSAMACIVIEGLLAVVLVLAGLREAVVRAVPLALKLSIGVGIGLSSRSSGCARADRGQRPGDRHRLGDLTAGPPLIALAACAAIALAVRAASRGAILAGIVARPCSGWSSACSSAPDRIADCPGSGSFSTIGDALAPTTSRTR